LGWRNCINCAGGSGAALTIILHSCRRSEDTGGPATFASVGQTTDGFQIAEADLKLRRSGELLGKEQSGLPPFRFGNLAEDRLLVERAEVWPPIFFQRGHKS